MPSICIIVLALFAHGILADPTGKFKHGVSFIHELKYSADFEHFDYLNPDAPKGGRLVIPTLYDFNALSPLAWPGNPAPGSYSTYDSLLIRSGDELSGFYGLLAEGIAVAADRRSVVIRLHQDARWHDGMPVTAKDVKFTFETIKANVQRFPLDWVSSIEIVNDREFVIRTIDDITTSNVIQLAFIWIMPAHFWVDKDPTAASLEPSLGSGPYRIAAFEQGRYVTIERVPDYWGRDIPVNRGRYNFDEIQFEVFRDASIAREAVLKGAVDTWTEQDIRHWVSSYNIPARDKGWLIQTTRYLRIEIGVRLMLSLNNQRAPFNDARVCEALTYAMDFDWQNRVLHSGVLDRANSHFPGTIFAATELPTGAELKLLEPFRAQLPARVFIDAFALPRSDAIGSNRPNLLRARELLTEAGWQVRAGILVNHEGDPYEIEFLSRSAVDQRTLLPYIDSLAKLGITGHIRNIESVEYINRRRQRQYDALLRNHDILNPPIIELQQFYHSSGIEQPLSANIAGISHLAIDAFVEAAITATTLDEMVAACRALDRALLWGFYQIPLYQVTDPYHVYWDKFGQPARGLKAKYIAPFPDGWWYDAEKAGRIKITM